MKKIFIVLYVFLVLVETGCHEADYVLFNDIARVQMSGDEEVLYDFFYKDRNTVMRDTVYLTVHTIGDPEGRARRIVLEQIPEYDVDYQYDNKGNLIDSVVTEKPNKAVAGVHYVAMNSEEMQPLLFVAPGAVSVQVPVILLRDASLRTEEVRLCLKLVATEDFQLGEASQLSRTIIFADKLSKPSKWNASIDRYYFGTYSARKHEFMYSVAGEKIDDEWFTWVMMDFAELTYFKNKFKNALEKYNADPENIAQGLAPMREVQDDPKSALVVFP
ncbi:MAG: DUF4843 domain-containing protein [Odoribacter sp.]|nr:DUF4843 domain-containing protein [Odoribacter sp.]